MADLTITHRPAEGTLIDGTSRNDGTTVILKANGWRWGRSIGTWYVPHSRDQLEPKSWIVNATKAALEEAGHTVTVDITRDGARSMDEREADREERAEHRAEYLTDRAERHQAESDARYGQFKQIIESIPLGQPILVGHHSERRHRKDIERMDTHLRKSVEAEQAANYAAHRAELAATEKDRRHNPVTVANRIAKLEAEIRRFERRRDGKPGEVVNSPWGPVDTSVAPATGAERERLEAYIADRTEQVEYWRRIRDEQIATGAATNYSRETIKVGGLVKIRGSWELVEKVNPKTVAAKSVHMPWALKYSYAEVQDYRPPAG